jgi:predicted nucleic acid-binding protein
MSSSASEAVVIVAVSDTSPITNLAAVGHLDLLQMLYGQINLPEEARDELVFGGSGNNLGAQEVLTAG